MNHTNYAFRVQDLKISESNFRCSKHEYELCWQCTNL